MTQNDRAKTTDDINEVNKIDPVLHLPSFIENNIFMKPFIELVMTIEEDQFKLDKTEDEIVER